MRDGLRFGILTVSDRCFAGQAEDKSGSVLSGLVKKLFPFAKITKTACVPDEEVDIISVLKDWTDGEGAVDVLLTTGGTGFAPRDVTPEATRKVLQKEVPAMATAMVVASLAHTPHAALSRAVCGLREGALIINLPGSPKGASECFEAIAMTLPHAVAVARGRQAVVATDHGETKRQNSSCTTLTSQSHGHVHSCGHHNHGYEQTSHAHPRDALNVPLARRPRSSPFPMVSVNAAQKIIHEESEKWRCEGEPYETKLALGHVTYGGVIAREDFPPFAASLKDGYAVIAADGSGPRKVVAVAAAGHETDVVCLKLGECVRINTGAALPPGADAIVQVEDTRLLKEAENGEEEVEVDILISPSVGLDVRPQGSDYRKGQEVLPGGALISPAELALLWGAGFAETDVWCEPRIVLLSTGDELVEEPICPHDLSIDEWQAKARKGRIVDTNKVMLTALLQQNGFRKITDLGIAEDSHESMRYKLIEAVRRADVVVTTGSVSMGDRDFLKKILLDELGATIHFGRVNMKPGKPTTFATLFYENKVSYLLGLPGNPVSALVTAHLFLLPLLKNMVNHPKPFPTVLRATIDGDFSLDPRPEYHRVVLTWLPGKDLPVARSTGSQASSSLLSVVGANGLAMLPAATESCAVLHSGTVVDVMLLRDI